MKLTLAGTGRAAPAQLLPTETLERRLNLSPGTLEAATGVRSRHVVTDEDQITLGTQAARAALDDAGLGPEDVSLCLFAAAVPYQPIPSTAPLILGRLGVPDGQAMGFDVNSTCLSFLTALDLAAKMIADGGHHHALIVSAEIASRALPWQDDPETAALFGDGAAAAVVSAEGSGRIRAARMATYPSAAPACQIGAGGTRIDFHRDAAAFAQEAVFRMDGKDLFRVTAKHFRGFVDTVLSAAGWTSQDVDVVVPHQASPFALAHMAKMTGFDGDRLIDISRDVGNQIAASIPFALDTARRDGRIGNGQKVLFLGTSAGVSFGGLALET